MAEPAWYLKRLARMSPPEIAYRLRQALNRKWDKYTARPALHPAMSSAELRIPWLTREDLLTRCAGFRAAAIERARAAAAHRFTLFGQCHDFGSEIDWHRDPRTGNAWPRRFWGDIDYRDGTRVGGIKFAWEVNRLHHLPHLALGYALTGDEALRRELFAQLVHWQRENPYPSGINWISGIELGIRIVNIFFAVRFLGEPNFTAGEQRLLVGFIVQHAEHLARYPSKYSSCANHALAEALGLFIAGQCCPDHPRSAHWRNFGREVLEREVLRQIHPDGSSFEHSVPYLPFVVDHFLIYRQICRFYGMPYGDGVDRRIDAAVGYLDSLSDSAGNYPCIGDDDDGYLLRLDFDGLNNAVSLRNTGALLYGRSEWLRGIDQVDAKSLLLLDADAPDRWEAAKREHGGSTACNARYFPDAGVAAVRGNAEGRETLFIGNSGPLGLAPLAGHGHADALSIWLSVNGQPLLVDPGTYLYHGGGKWRDYFRSTVAHNTLRIDGKDQAEMIADFMFDQAYPVCGELAESGNEEVRWRGRHEGYRRLPDPVVHAREVRIAAEGGLLEIIDTVEAAGRHEVECYFHFHPRCEVRAEEGRVVVRAGRAGLTMTIDSQWSRCELFRGSQHPLAGWYSASFGRLEETATLVLGAVTQGTARFGCVMSVTAD